ncbi:PH domain-containing protein [Streptomyces sp. V4-01]|uniref:PH domain-containing protein n=1 Tax=Actinacidiphila polyblastidii TaxID=3110430 RepID=A0ABU7PG86_9ACTN|nr:PH domain-containing protein [Streptomyces sp. V4-01]
MAAGPVVVAASTVQEDLTRTPAWWWLPVEALGLAGCAWLALRMLLWRITATPQGLRVRRLRRETLLPWAEVTEVTGNGAGALTFVGACAGPATAGGGRVVLDYAGFPRSRGTAGEITALIRDPALRPTG